VKLSRPLQLSISLALTEAARRRHELAGLEHLLFALLLDRETAQVLHRCGADLQELQRELESFLEEEVEVLPDEERREPQPTLGFQRAIARAAAHIEGAGREEVYGYHVLVAMFDEPDSYAIFFLGRQGVGRFDLVSLIAHGIETTDPDGSPWSPGSGEGAEAPGGTLPGAAPGERRRGEPQGDPLKAFTQNLTALAGEGQLDPVIGRDAEIRRTFHILVRRRKNNPIYVGDPGVGKTALAEALAQEIAAERAPGALHDAVVYRLDLGALVAGTRYRGDFEQRIKAVLQALEKQDKPILFIDEIHTLIGAGAAGSGTMDASNLLKPALQSGSLRVVGATTWTEYRQIFERDRALARRFQKVEVQEPSIGDTVKILRGLRSRYEAHHGVTYTQTALKAAAELSARYLRDRHLPDKAIDLIDEAGAAVQLLERKRVGVPEVEQVLATMAQIPARRVQGDDRERLRSLELELKTVVFGQDEAIAQLVAAIKVARAGLRDPDKPTGAFLMTGPTGVGKTEVARQLADALGIAFLRFDMSEYMERHTVSRLVGAPPGYVGFDQGGLLTEAVSKNPHAVLLLDEIEKAHGDVFNLLLQVLDHGTLTDTNGKKADFRHVIVLMTSNAGARELAARGIGFDSKGAAGADQQAYERLFSPELRNRLDARIPFLPLSPEVMERIVEKFVRQLQAQLRERKVTIELSDAARSLLAEEGYDPVFGARPLSRVIDRRIKQPLTDHLLFGELTTGGVVRVGAKEGEITLEFD